MVIADLKDASILRNSGLGHDGRPFAPDSWMAWEERILEMLLFWQTDGAMAVPERAQWLRVVYHGFHSG